MKHKHAALRPTFDVHIHSSSAASCLLSAWISIGWSAGKNHCKTSSHSKVASTCVAHLHTTTDTWAAQALIYTHYMYTHAQKTPSFSVVFILLPVQWNLAEWIHPPITTAIFIIPFDFGVITSLCCTSFVLICICFLCWNIHHQTCYFFNFLSLCNWFKSLA